MFDEYTKKTAAKRLLEEQLYEQVALELQQGNLRAGLWAKALADSNGIEHNAKSLYIKYRVQSLKDELVAMEIAREQAREQQARIYAIDREILNHKATRKYLPKNPSANAHIEMIEKMNSMDWSIIDMLAFFNRNNVKCLSNDDWSAKMIEKIIDDFKLNNA